MISPDRDANRRRVRWWLGCVAVVALTGWGIGHILAGVRAPGPPPRLPARVVALPSTSEQSATSGRMPGRMPGRLPSRLTPMSRSTPTKIVIPAIGLRAGIEPVDARADGGIATPSLARAKRAAWFRPGPSPGEAGAAVIAGHVDDKKKVAVFYYLTRLRPGDRIEVHREDGGIAYFTVQSLEEVPKDAFPGDRVYGGGDASLRLITCGGRWDRFRATYVDNIIVFARLTALKPPPGDSVAR